MNNEGGGIKCIYSYFNDDNIHNNDTILLYYNCMENQTWIYRKDSLITFFGVAFFLYDRRYQVLVRYLVGVYLTITLMKKY